MLLKRWWLVLYIGFWGGAIGVLGKLALTLMSPSQLIFSRILISLLILSLVLVAKGQLGQTLELIKSNLGHFVLLAVSGVGLAMVLGFLGLQATSAIAYDLIFNLSGVFIIVFGWIIFGDQPTRRELWLTALAFLGAGLVITRNGELSWGTLGGDLLVLLAASGWGLYSILGGQAKIQGRAFDPLTNLFGSLVIAWLVMLPYIYIFEPFRWGKWWAGAAVVPLLSVVALAVFGTAGLFLFWLQFVRQSSSAASAIVALLENVGGMVWPMLFLGELLTWRAGIGGALIVISLLFI